MIAAGMHRQRGNAVGAIDVATDMKSVQSDGSIRAMIVGAGLMGRFHAKAAQRSGAHVCAIVDSDWQSAVRLAGRFQNCVATTCLSSALAQIEPDVVHVCSPEPTHYQLAAQVAAAGAHALIEKPLASNTREVRELLELFHMAATFVVPVHQYALQPCVEKAARRCSSIGPLRQITFDIRSAGGGTDPSRFDEIAGIILPHPLSLIQRLFPDHNLDSQGWGLTSQSPGEWIVSSTVGQTSIQIAISMNARPTAFTTRVFGDRGSLEIDHFNGFMVESPAASSPRHKIAFPFLLAGRQLVAASHNLAGRLVRREFAYVGLQSLVAAFYAAVQSGRPGDLPVTPTQVIAGAQVRDDILELLLSARHGLRCG